MSLPYWFSIERAEVFCGGAFLITQKYALTAAHCLPQDFSTASESATPSIVKLVSENGTELLATVSEASGDLALLEIAAFRMHGIVAPQIRREPVEKESLWEAPYRPSAQHPMLTGVVGNPNLDFRCVDGSLISAIQLTVSEGIGDHSGYSGGPIVSKASYSESASILGVLIEQFPDQADQHRAANVLFAARVAHAFMHFAAFNFVDQLEISEDSLPKVPLHIEPTPRDISSRLSEADEILERAKLWSERSYIDDYDYRNIKARVRDLVFRSTGSRA